MKAETTPKSQPRYLYYPQLKVFQNRMGDRY